MTYELREARATDIPDIIRLCRDHARFEKAAYCDENKAEALSELLFGSDPQLFCLVVESDNSIVGYATYARQYSTWEAESYLHLDCLYLERRFRGFGIGRRIMKRLWTEAARLQCGHLQWQTPSFNTRAIEFYEKTGAKGTPRIRFTWPSKTETEIAVLSRKGREDKA